VSNSKRDVLIRRRHARGGHQELSALPLAPRPFNQVLRTCGLVTREYLRLVLGSCLGLFLAWLAFRNTDWQAVLAALGRVNVLWLLLSLLLAFTTHLLRVQRWSYIVRATRFTPFRPLLSSAQIGFLFNVALPMRLGEAVRTFVLTRLTHIRLATSAALVMLDRMSDMVGMLAVFLVVILSFPSAGSLQARPEIVNGSGMILALRSAVRPAALGAAAMLAAAIALLLLVHAKGPSVSDFCLRRLSKGVALRVSAATMRFSAGTYILRSRVDMAKCIAFSLAAWTCGVLSLGAGFQALGIRFPWNAPFVVQALIVMFVAIPLTPGLIGQFHVGVVAGLLMAVPGADVAQAKAVALVTHLVSLTPIVGLGVGCLLWERLSLLDITPTQGGLASPSAEEADPVAGPQHGRS
jgi:uncharacterized protein (TIRG00374 family)